jgi:hypothetical protein
MKKYSPPLFFAMGRGIANSATAQINPREKIGAN